MRNWKRTFITNIFETILSFIKTRKINVKNAVIKITINIMKKTNYQEARYLQLMLQM
jgi:hypothetical protein